MAAKFSVGQAVIWSDSQGYQRGTIISIRERDGAYYIKNDRFPHSYGAHYHEEELMSEAEYKTMRDNEASEKANTQDKPANDDIHSEPANTQSQTREGTGMTTEIKLTAKQEEAMKVLVAGMEDGTGIDKGYVPFKKHGVSTQTINALYKLRFVVVRYGRRGSGSVARAAKLIAAGKDYAIAQGWIAPAQIAAQPDAPAGDVTMFAVGDAVTTFKAMSDEQETGVIESIEDKRSMTSFRIRMDSDGLIVQRWQGEVHHAPAALQPDTAANVESALPQDAPAIGERVAVTIMATRDWLGFGTVTNVREESIFVEMDATRAVRKVTIKDIERLNKPDSDSANAGEAVSGDAPSFFVGSIVIVKESRCYAKVVNIADDLDDDSETVYQVWETENAKQFVIGAAGWYAYYYAHELLALTGEENTPQADTPAGDSANAGEAVSVMIDHPQTAEVAKLNARIADLETQLQRERELSGKTLSYVEGLLEAQKAENDSLRAALEVTTNMLVKYAGNVIVVGGASITERVNKNQQLLDK